MIILVKQQTDLKMYVHRNYKIFIANYIYVTFSRKFPLNIVNNFYNCNLAKQFH